MLGYAIKRFLGALPTLFIIVTVAFFMMRAAPGGPFDNQRANCRPRSSTISKSPITSTSR